MLCSANNYALWAYVLYYTKNLLHTNVTEIINYDVGLHVFTMSNLVCCQDDFRLPVRLEN